MSSELCLLIVIIYFLLLIVISYYTSRKATNQTFFTSNRNSPWYLVAFGMIGASLSGVTFISIPGEVGNSAWKYLPLVLGNCIGYIFIAQVLLPLFYKKGLVSIYSWLEERFGENAKLIGSFFFIISQLIGASFRLFLVVGVLQLAVFNQLGISFELTVIITILLVWLYTFKGGIKTIVWTDTLQTFFMLLSVIITVGVIAKSLQFDLASLINTVIDNPSSQILEFDWRDKHNFLKQFISGLAMTIAINGLDQNMMQKNLTCKNLEESKKNMFTFTFLFLICNIIFLTLGSMLYIYAEQTDFTLPQKSDEVFASIALGKLGAISAICFILGVVAAAYSSVDSSLTSLTTSFSIDFLKLNTIKEENKNKRVLIHFIFSVLMCLVIIIFKYVNNSSVVSAVFTAVGYTYGPILGLFAFGLTTKYSLKVKYIPYICITSPILSFFINLYSKELLNGYQFGFEILILNALLCFLGLLLIRTKTHH